MSRRSLFVFVFMIVAIAVASLILRPGAEPAPLSRQETAELAATSPAESGVGVLRAAKVPPEVPEFIRNGQWWRAARAMRAYLRASPDAGPAEVLLAARAEAGWGGWDRVRALLEGREWLDAEAAGEGWYWLARALEEDQEWEAAMQAYGRYLRASGETAAADQRQVAELRQGLILLRLGRVEEGTDLLEELREKAPDIAPRVDLLAAEALATRGDTARVRGLVRGDGVQALGIRPERALLRAYREAGDTVGARRLALSFRQTAEGAAARAEFSLAAGELALAAGDRDAARQQLLAALEAEGSTSAHEAARLLSEMGGLSAAEHLRVARVYDRHGNNIRAAEGYRSWLGAGEGSAAERNEVRFRLGSALFDAGRYAEAEVALRPLADAPASLASKAVYLIGRAQYRRGARERAQQTFLRAAEEYPRSDPGSEALFLVADLSHDAGETTFARQIYRRVATEFPGADRAGLSLMRLGGIAFVRGDYAAAADAWEEYRSSYPRGERWLQSTYWAGRAYEEAGDLERARARYRAVREREPLSYYALRAAERLGEPFWPIPMGPSPAEDPAARRRVEGWMQGVDLLRAAGLHEEAEAEIDNWIRRAGDDPALAYPLAEVLNERGYSLRGIRLGLRLRRDEGLNERLLRILYPFPYRELIRAEATEKGLDPSLVAALTRQESMFKARISSPVGARGLMQIMPETGSPLARSVGIRDWDPELLFNPEINAHLGTIYLAEQMDAYDGSLPSVFSAYNAGPHRVEQWKEFPEYGNEELFTERIPYRETRDYVKILTRNIAIYEGLYGKPGGEE